MHAVACRGCTNIVRKSALKIDSGEKLSHSYNGVSHTLHMWQLYQVCCPVCPGDHYHLHRCMGYQHWSLQWPCSWWIVGQGECCRIFLTSTFIIYCTPPFSVSLSLTQYSSTLSKSCLTGSNWYGCILVGLSGKVSVSSSELELAILQQLPRVT